MIKVKLGDLIAANGSLTEMGELTTIPPTSAFRLARVIRKSADEVTAWNKARRAIMKQSGKASPHPQIPSELWIDPKTITLDDADSLEAEMDALNATEVEIEANPMKVSEFGDKAELKPKWLAHLHWLIGE